MTGLLAEIAWVCFKGKMGNSILDALNCRCKYKEMVGLELVQIDETDLEMASKATGTERINSSK